MQTLTTKQTQEMTRSGSPLVVNVLDEKDFEEHHIPGSQNIPLGTEDFTQRVEEAAGSKERPVIVYCASETCDASTKASQKLEKAGFTQVFDYKGGMESWEQAGLPIDAGAMR